MYLPILLHHHLSVYQFLQYGHTALDRAACSGRNDICSLLLEKGADITARDTVSDRTCMASRAHTYTSPPPGDLTLPYLPPYITFPTNLIFFLPHYPPLFLPTPSSRTPMAAIIACYSVYAHYHQRVGMYALRYPTPYCTLPACPNTMPIFFCVSFT